MYPVVDKMGGKVVVALYGTPGLKSYVDLSLPTNPVRGLHVWGDYLYAVVGPFTYQITKAKNTTLLSANLNTREGNVWMQDNGLDATSPHLVIVDEDYGYYTTIGGVVTEITDANFPANPQGLAILDGRFITIDKDTGDVYISTALTGSAWDSNNPGTTSASPDHLVAPIVYKNKLWLFGEKGVEVDYASGAAFYFDRIPGAYIEYGLGAAASLTKWSKGLIWLSDKRQVVVNSGYEGVPVSTEHVEFALAGYSTVADARAFSYIQEGMEFYFITFPTANKTWVYDLLNGFWHERAYGNNAENRHRANCYAYFDGKHLVGDHEKGVIYELDMDTFDDNGDIQAAIRITPTVHAKGRRIFHHTLEVEHEAGVGLATGQGSDPQAMIRYSGDFGRTWSNQQTSPVGKIGEYENRARWQQLGMDRNRNYEWKMTDPVKRVITGAYLDGDIGPR